MNGSDAEASTWAIVSRARWGSRRRGGGARPRRGGDRQRALGGGAAGPRVYRALARPPRFTGGDLGPGLWKVSREAVEHPTLIGGPGATAAERDRQVAARRRLDARFLAHDFTMTAWSIRRVPLGLLVSTAAF